MRDVLHYAFRAFSSPLDLLSRLIDRVKVEGVEEEIRPLIKVRYYLLIFRTVKFVWDWFKSFSAIDFNSPESKMLFNYFTEEMMDNLPISAKGSGSLSRGLRNCQRYFDYAIRMGPGTFRPPSTTIKPRVSRGQRSASITNGGKSAPPIIEIHPTDKLKNMTLLDFDCVEIVTELTRREYDYMKAVSPEMLSLNLWGSQKDTSVKDMIKPIQDSIEFFNTVTTLLTRLVTGLPLKYVLNQK